jgi:hypothetical protein
MNLTPQIAIAGWEAAIKANEEHIQRKQKLVNEKIIAPELSGIKVLEAENEMYRLFNR